MNLVDKPSGTPLGKKNDFFLSQKISSVNTFLVRGGAVCLLLLLLATTLHVLNLCRLNGKTLFLKIQLPYAIKHGEIKLVYN